MDETQHRPANRQRLVVAIGVGVPVLLFVALLTWGAIRTGGEQGRPGVNDVFGEAPISSAQFPQFEVTTLDGEKLALYDLRGSVVMIDFWSSWCAPCRAEAPILAEAYRRWRDRGVEFVGISIWDSESAVQSFIESRGIEFPIAFDDGTLTVEFGVKGIPEKFILNREGEVVRKIIGPNTTRTLDDVLSQLLEAEFTDSAG